MAPWAPRLMSGLLVAARQPCRGGGLHGYRTSIRERKAVPLSARQLIELAYEL
jgi:hypothetical protein